MIPFEVVPELKVGSIIEVAGDLIRIEIDKTLNELTQTHAGDVYPVGQCGSILKIHSGRQILFAYVRVLRMRSELSEMDGRPSPKEGEDARIIDATLFAEGRWNAAKACLRLDRGVRNYPLPGQSAYLTTFSELGSLFSPQDVSDSNALRIPIGNYVGSRQSTCYANLDKLVGLHCAVLGSTGAGKSGTVAAIIRSILDAEDSNGKARNLRPRIVIFDPHAEYSKAFADRAIVYQAYNSLACEKSKIKELRLPYWTMSGDEFRDLLIGKTEWEATSEANIVFKALRHARLVERGLIEPAMTNWKGKTVDPARHPADDRPVNNEQQALDLIASYNRDVPDRFCLKEFRRHVECEQMMRDNRGSWDLMSASDRKSHDSILDKLRVLESDPRLKFLMENGDGEFDLTDVIKQFVGTPSAGDVDATNKDIRIIETSGLPNEVAGPLAAAIGRILFEYKTWETRAERELDPVLIVCEEAHRYVPNAGLAEYASAQRSIRRIAKEGRKYGLGLMLVSQRPADVEGTVLSQCNSWIVMRLTNTSDQQHVKRFLPDNLAGLAELLPSLSQQEAIFVGDASSLPARIRIRDLAAEHLPDSENISCSSGWMNAPTTDVQIGKVVNRWRRVSE